jgi:hypothetical protein
MNQGSSTAGRTGDAYCPHCHLLIARDVAHPWPERPLRCDHCRLLVGDHRSRRTPEADPGARGSAAGVFAHEARRGAGDADVSRDAVCEAIRTVADEVGAQPDRLLMLQYQERAAVDEELPTLEEVFAAYGTWKRARRAAAAGGR